MTPSELNYLRSKIQTLSDDELLTMLALEAENYRPEALAIAQEELQRRGLDESEVQALREEVAAERFEASGFCRRCYEDTTDESPGSTFTLNFLFGTRLMGARNHCPNCGSVVSDKYFWFVIPIARLGTYRVIYLKRGLLSKEYVGRRLKGW